MPETDQQTTLPKPASKLRIPIEKQSVVKALLSEGLTHRSIEQAVGINRTTIAKISKQEIASSEHAEKIKKGLRNRFAMIADRSLNSLSDEKLAEASAKDLIYIAAKATEIAAPAAPSVLETYSKTLQTFLTQDGTPQVVGTETVVKTITQPLSDNS